MTVAAPDRVALLAAYRDADDRAAAEAARRELDRLAHAADLGRQERDRAEERRLAEWERRARAAAGDR